MNRYLVVLFVLVSHGCNSQPCDKLTKSFSTYDQAESLVESASFRIKESISTSKSSWIRCAKYYSCDGKTGFFVICTDSEDYIHQDMPIGIWHGFKNAQSFGTYYNKNIRGLYWTKLNNR